MIHKYERPRVAHMQLGLLQVRDFGGFPLVACIFKHNLESFSLILHRDLGLCQVVWIFKAPINIVLLFFCFLHQGGKNGC